MLGEGTRNTDTLFLPAGKSYTTLTDNGVVLFVHFFNKAARLGTCCCTPDFIHLHRFPVSHFDILLDRIGEEEDILQNYRNASTELS